MKYIQNFGIENFLVSRLLIKLFSHRQCRVPIFPDRFAAEAADQFRADPGGMSVKKDF